MERTIGDLSQEIKQPSNPYGNLAERNLRCARTNALKIICPNVDPDQGYTLPRNSVLMGEGLVLLRPRERSRGLATNNEETLLLQQQ
ncbi:hypothetical protein BT96DRAFT_839205 [Gymnopus androsaceus JB14]|uniref:Uncharacterized protein n=1 Tax=Gymnopus androsaceus JB14 TaxID=1447944 RepID=A0A6A4GMH7_9AGAR|nr:hypothetical protein BT96DRAFT_839205 [Gymnopus androsaceus JB14]